MTRTRKSFFILSAAVAGSWGQDFSVPGPGVFVLDELVVEAESLEDEEPIQVIRPRVILPPRVLPPPPPEEEDLPQETKPAFGGPSATTLAGDELKRALRSTLGETLAGEPGVSASSFSAGASRPIIRGLDGFRVATLVDGLGSLDLSQESPDHGVAIDTGLAEALEIYRGPSALRYGSGAIGGAINTVTRLRPTLAPEGDWETVLSAGFDSQGNGVRGSIGAKLADGPWAVSVYSGYRQSDDISIPGNARTQQYEELVRPRIFVSQEIGSVPLPNPEGTLPNSFHESTTWSAGLSFGSPDSLQVGLSFAQFTSNYGIPFFFDGDEAGLFGQTFIETALNRVDADLSYNTEGQGGIFSKLSLRLAAGWFDQSENFEGLDRNEGTDFASVEFERQSLEARLELFNGEKDSILSGVTGVNVTANQTEARRFTLQIAGTDDTLLEDQATGIYTSQKLAWEELTLEFGIRGEFGTASSDTGSLIEENTETLSQSVSLGWETKRLFGLKKFGLTYTASMSERAPSAVERYAFWSNEALGNFIIGGDIASFLFNDIDGTLGNERSSHQEISVSADWGWGNGIVTGYDTHFDNFIFLESRPGIGFEPTAIYVGREARIRGLEGLAKFPLWEDAGADKGLELKISGDWIMGRDLTREQELPRMPAPKLGTTLSYHSPTWKAYLELRRSFGSSSTPREPVPEFETDPYTLLNAGITWTPGWADGALEMNLRGSNLLDSEIREHTSFRKETSPQPGIGVSMDVRWTF